MRAASLAIVLTLSCGVDAFACTCVTAPLKHSFKHASAFFVGDVFASDGVMTQVRIVETFKGSQRIRDIVTVKSGPWEETCGFRFYVGERYLVEATRDADGTLFTGLCTHTRAVEDEMACRWLEVLRKRSWWWQPLFTRHRER